MAKRPKKELTKQQKEKKALAVIPKKEYDLYTMLIELRDELYHSKWGEMKQDLTDRLKARPYIFQQVSRLKEDVERIERMWGAEVKYEGTYQFNKEREQKKITFETN